MNSFFSRISTGIISGIVGGVINCLSFLFVTYLMRKFSGNYVRADNNLDYAAFGVIGILFGIILGIIIGIIQPKPFKGFLIGGFVVFFIELILLLSDANQTFSGSATIVNVLVTLFLFLTLIVGGCFTGVTIGFISNAVKNLSQGNKETLM
jgi:hypothetical protein